MISFTDDNSDFSVEGVIGEGGLISQSFDAFEVRAQQVEMAKAVDKAFDKGFHLAVEAGTGVGKSFAYLVSAIAQVRKKRKVLISTYTINLQQQLINKDIPFLAEILPCEFTAELAKGRNNYLCKRRLKYALKKQKNLFDNLGDELEEISKWAKDSTDGSLSDIPVSPSSDAWDAVQSEHGNCLGRKCDSYNNCFYWNARRRLERADIIVANHAMMFSDLVLKEDSAGILPEYTYVVIDEAHNIEHVAESHFGINLSNYTISYLLRRLYSKRKKRGILAVKKAAEAISLCGEVEDASNEFFENVRAWYDDKGSKTNGKCQKGFVEDCLSEPIKALRLELSRLTKGSQEADDNSEITRYIDRCRAIEMDIKNFLEQGSADSIYWVEASGGRRKRTALRSAPLDVGPFVKRCLFDIYDSVVTTSATLSCDGPGVKSGFDFFASRIGLEDFQALRLGSPFDYENNVTMYVEANLPAPNCPEFEAAAAEAIKKYLIQSDGRAFVLFTSYKMLKNIASDLQYFLHENDMNLLCQGAGADRGRLLEQFKKDYRSVLFGTDSFWQGVDVPGESLSNVIIMRLPFAVPNHPLIEGRIDQIRSRGENPFFTYQLPTAIIKFKQGFGRLIRNKTDKGIVVVLDSRIVRKNYGRMFVNAVEKCKMEIVTDEF
ncbi:MAG: helicase [Planctomycetes bacterium]|nr:helicase [Planctomycetota bacterium]